MKLILALTIFGFAALTVARPHKHKAAQHDGDEFDDEHDDDGQFIMEMFEKMAESDPAVAAKLKEAKAKMEEFKASGTKPDEEKMKAFFLKLATDAGVDVSMFENAKPSTEEEEFQLLKKFIDANKAKYPVLEEIVKEWEQYMNDEGFDDEFDDDFGEEHGEGHFIMEMFEKMAESDPALASKLKEAKAKLEEFKASGTKLDEEKMKAFFLKLATDAGVDVSMLENAKPSTEEEEFQLLKKFIDANKAKYPKLEEIIKEWEQYMNDENFGEGGGGQGNGGSGGGGGGGGNSGGKQHRKHRKGGMVNQ